jgi:hypothetical protein
MISYALEKLLASIEALSLCAGSRKWESAAVALAPLNSLKAEDFKSEEAKRRFIDLKAMIPASSNSENEYVAYVESGASKLARSHRGLRKAILEVFQLELNNRLHAHEISAIR